MPIKCITSLTLTTGMMITAACTPVFATTQIYNEIGHFTFNPPSGVTQITFTAIGGGGGGGGGGGAYDLILLKGRGAGGGGGGGGASVTCTVNVSPNETVEIDVGRGGKGGNAGSLSQDGGRGEEGGASIVTATSIELPLGGGGFYPEPYSSESTFNSFRVGGGVGGSAGSAGVL